MTSRFLTTIVGVLVSWSFVALVWSTPAHANSIVFTEDFSDTLEKWESTRAHADWWKIVNGVVEATVPTPSTIIELVPKDQFWDPTWKNIEYELDYTPIAGIDKNISFGFENLLNWYEIHFLEQWYSFDKLVNGAVPFSINNSFIMQNGKTYHVKIKFLSGFITISVDGAVILDTYDHTFNQDFGKIGIKAGTGSAYPTKIQFDNIQVTTLDERPPLPPRTVQALKQTDPSWSSLEYDSAKNWSENPSIGRWGCALTSMAMILRYHTITKLPDGQEITPATLNDWLLSQPDGYIGEGALNWLAVTRLTRLVSEMWDTPKLEYSAVSGAATEPARDELLKHNPVIFQIPGHFLVADSITEKPNDFFIKDPAYQLQRFSQHKAPLLSTRIFHPSYTDLSYILVVHDPEISVSFSDSQHQPVAAVRTIEQLVEPNTTQGEHTLPVAMTTLAKPSLSEYSVTVTPTTFSSDQTSIPFSSQIWLYDQEGNSSKLDLSGIVSSQPQNYTLILDPDGNHRLKSPTTWETWRTLLRATQSSEEPLASYYYQLLWYLSQNAEWYSPLIQKQIASTLLLLVNQAPQTLISSATKFSLEAELKALTTVLP